MTKDESLKLALEALHGFIPYLPLNDEVQCGRYDEALTAIKEALAQLEHEPVCDKDPQGCWNVRCQLGKKCKNTPTQRIWVGLTKEDVDSWELPDTPTVAEFAWFVEAKLKEKNT